MNRPVLLFRTAAILLLLFAVGHTFGFLTLVPPTPEARAVRASMDSATFSVHGQTFSYGGFYLGLGLFVTAFMLFAAVLAWRLGAMARRASPDVRFLGGLLTLVMLVSLALALRYFSTAPATLSALVALATGAAAFLSAGSPSSSC